MMIDTTKIEREIASLKVDIDHSMYHRDRARYIRLLYKEYINQKKIVALAKKRLELVQKSRAKPLEERLNTFRIRHSQFFDMLEIWHRSRNSYLENAISDYARDYRLTGFLDSVGRHCPHEKIKKHLGKYNTAVYYRVKDFVNEQKSRKLEELEQRVKKVETKYPAVKRYIQTTKRLQDELEKRQYMQEKSLYSLIKCGAKKLLQKYRRFKGYGQ